MGVKITVHNASVRRLALVWLVIAMSASTNVMEAAPAAEQIVDAPYEPDYAKGLAERQLWHALRKSFIRHRYPQILKRYRSKLNCGTCIGAFIDVAFAIDLAGQVSIHRIDKAQACGGDFPPGMREDFIQFLKVYPYPTGLLGKSVRLRLGRHVRC